MNNADAVYREAIVDYAPAYHLTIVDLNEGVEQLGVHPDHQPTLWDRVDEAPTEVWELSMHMERVVWEVWQQLNGADSPMLVDTLLSKRDAYALAKSYRKHDADYELASMIWVERNQGLYHNGVHFPDCDHDCDIAHGWIPIGSEPLITNIDEQYVRDDGYSNVPSPKL